MRAWGATAFENDQALDWLGNGVTLKRIRSALAAVPLAPPDHVLDADECQEALAAVECIAAARGHALEKLPDDARKGLAAVRRGLTPKDLKVAKAVLASVTSASELQALWGESATWRTACTELAQRLGKPPKALPHFKGERKREPHVGDVVLVPLPNGSRGVVKIIAICAAAPEPFQFGVYPLRVAAGEEPSRLPPVFAEILHGLARLGPTGWPVVRNEPVLAAELAPIATTATSQPDRTRARMPQFQLEQLASGLRVEPHADGTATVSFTENVAAALAASFPFSGWLAKLVEEIVAYGEAHAS